MACIWNRYLFCWTGFALSLCLKFWALLKSISESSMLFWVGPKPYTRAIMWTIWIAFLSKNHNHFYYLKHFFNSALKSTFLSILQQLWSFYNPQNGAKITQAWKSKCLKLPNVSYPFSKRPVDSFLNGISPSWRNFLYLGMPWRNVASQYKFTMHMKGPPGFYCWRGEFVAHSHRAELAACQK